MSEEATKPEQEIVKKEKNYSASSYFSKISKVLGPEYKDDIEGIWSMPEPQRDGKIAMFLQFEQLKVLIRIYAQLDQLTDQIRHQMLNPNKTPVSSYANDDGTGSTAGKRILSTGT